MCRARTQVLAAYKKSHVWFKKCFDEPTTPDLVTFNASFGVQFGIFTCVAVCGGGSMVLAGAHPTVGWAAGASTSCFRHRARRLPTKV